MYRHHNFEERLNIVSRLLSGEPLESLCKELKMDKKMVRLWYLRYKKYGEEGLRGIRHSHYTADKKLAIVKEFVENGVILQELCLQYDLSRSAIKSWVRMYRQGLSLENRRRGRLLYLLNGAVYHPSAFQIAGLMIHLQHNISDVLILYAGNHWSIRTKYPLFAK